MVSAAEDWYCIGVIRCGVGVCMGGIMVSAGEHCYCVSANGCGMVVYGRYNCWSW